MTGFSGPLRAGARERRRRDPYFWRNTRARHRPFHGELCHALKRGQCERGQTLRSPYQQPATSNREEMME